MTVTTVIVVNYTTNYTMIMTIIIQSESAPVKSESAPNLRLS